MRRLLLGMAVAAIAALLPCWAHADDQQIAQQIVQRLQNEKAEGRLTGFGIDLEVESGIVWLKGHVTSPEQQQLVLDIARRVNGVEQVVNDLRVKSVAAEPAPSRVRPALLKSDGDTNVLQKSGQLLGNLRGSMQRALRPESEPVPAMPAKNSQVAARQPVPAKPAEPTPAQPPEVLAAPRTTTVAQSRPSLPTDEELAEEVIGRLSTQKDRGALRQFNVDVRVDDRVVWVSGSVASESQRTLVLDVARRVRGVKQVVNDLEVVEPGTVQVVSAPVVNAAPPAAQMMTQQAAPAMAPAPAPFPYAQSPQYAMAARPVPLAFAPAQSVGYAQPMAGQPMAEVPAATGVARARFDNPAMPGYAWPSYAAYPNYAAVTYPRQYSPTAWPYIGPFYPYPQVPLGWRKVTLEWDDGWWFLDFKSK